jgi:hypothetical protein
VDRLWVDREVGIVDTSPATFPFHPSRASVLPPLDTTRPPSPAPDLAALPPSIRPGRLKFHRAAGTPSSSPLPTITVSSVLPFYGILPHPRRSNSSSHGSHPSASRSWMARSSVLQRSVASFRSSPRSPAANSAAMRQAPRSSQLASPTCALLHQALCSSRLASSTCALLRQVPRWFRLVSPTRTPPHQPPRSSRLVSVSA